MNSLLDKIRDQIQKSQHNSISFFQFMDMALYDEEQGYYMKNNPKIGKEGDFYTSVNVGSIFGEILANALARYLMQLQEKYRLTAEPLIIVEFGGGTGDLALHVLRCLNNKIPDLMQSTEYVMVEKSKYHRQIQQEKLKGYSVTWVEDIQDGIKRFGRVSGIFFSNELIDAFPVHVVERYQDRWMEVRVTWDEEGGLREILFPLTDDNISTYLEEEEVPAMDGLRTEVNLMAHTWIQDIGTWLRQGYIITIDYGMLREELFHPARKKGTLISYYKHQITDNIYENVGNQDITSHVNFSALIRWGKDAGLQKVDFVNQSQFLVDNGILDRLQSHNDTDPFSPLAKRNRAVRQLIIAGGMGETFKVLIQKKDV